MNDKNGISIVRMDDCKEEMLKLIREGQNKGSTTHIESLDNAWRWRKKEFNLITGYQNEGKSIFFRYLALIKAVEDGWKFAFSAPEDYPAHEFFDDIIHTYTGRTTDRDRPEFIGEKAYLEAIEKLKDKFYFVYLKPPNNSIKQVLEQFEGLIESVGIDVCVLDPLIKFARPREYMERDDQYAMYVTTLCTDFCRQHDISLNLVMHQITPRLNESGQFMAPNPYYIKGGGTWSDGCDNVLSIWRPNYAKDKYDTSVRFSSLKIKKQKLVGIPQSVDMKFDRKTNRFVDNKTEEDLYKFRDHPARRGVNLKQL